MKNIIDAIVTLLRKDNFELTNSTVGKNRANSRGDALELYVKNLFADTFDCSKIERAEKWDETFSWLGNSNNPPDFMLKGGDAVEFKKIESPDAALALNSSYPKHTLKSSSPLISKACREAEDWTEKEIIYVVGVVSGKKLKHLCMVYGHDYFASEECYRQMEENVYLATALKFSSNEPLDVMIPVDPLGITCLKISVSVQNPWQSFDYVHALNFQAEFDFMSMIDSETWEHLKNREELVELQKNFPTLKIIDVKIQNPDNPAKLKLAKLITYIKECVEC